MTTPAAAVLAGSPKPTTKREAIKKVDRHVSPKDCFVWFASSKQGWIPIPGTGCAHYVAHQLAIKRGAGCDAGYTIRVPELVAGLSKVAAADVAVNDIWANAGLTHTGLVVEIKEGAKRDFVIEHCSSRQGAVVRNEWRAYFAGQGVFYRPKGAGVAVPQAKSAARRSGHPVGESFA